MLFNSFIALYCAATTLIYSHVPQKNALVSDEVHIQQFPKDNGAETFLSLSYVIVVTMHVTHMFAVMRT